MCGVRPGVCLIETVPRYQTSRSTACSTRELSRACAREYRNAESPGPAYQTSSTVSVVLPDDNGPDQNAWRASRKKCYGTYRRDLGIQLWFPPLSAGALG